MIFARQKMDGAGRTNLRDIATRSVGSSCVCDRPGAVAVAIDAPATGRFYVNGNAQSCNWPCSISSSMPSRRSPGERAARFEWSSKSRQGT